MQASSVFRPHLESAATARCTHFDPEGAFRGLVAQRFELVSRGDFVPGYLYLPASCAGGAPLVLLQHGLGGSKSAAYLDCAARWVREGFAVAAIDLPLHGERQSPKLSARLVQGVDSMARDRELDPQTRALVEEFARQSTSDLKRTLDAITALETVDAERVGFVGFSLGAIVGTYLLAHDARPRAAVLALAGGAGGPAEFDPAEHLRRAGREANRALRTLVIAAEDDARIPLESSKALFDAASDPKEFLVSPGDHGALPGKTLGRIQSFLAEAFAQPLAG